MGAGQGPSPAGSNCRWRILLACKKEVKEMLLTHHQHLLSSFLLPQDSSAKSWSQVMLDLCVPYFLVSYISRKGRIKETQTCLLWHEDDLLLMCKEQGTGACQEIKQIAIILPPNWGGNKSWRMMSVKEIWQGKLRGHQQRAMIYVSVSSERFVNSLATNDERKIDIVCKIY